MLIDPTQILFWNCRGLRPHLHTLTASLKSISPKPAIFAFTETHFEPSDTTALQQAATDYHCFSLPHTRASGGTALLIRNDIAADPVHHGLPEFGRTETGDSSALCWIHLRPHNQSHLFSEYSISLPTPIFQMSNEFKMHWKHPLSSVYLFSWLGTSICTTAIGRHLLSPNQIKPSHLQISSMIKAGLYWTPNISLTSQPDLIKQMQDPSSTSR